MTDFDLHAYYDHLKCLCLTAELVSAELIRVQLRPSRYRLSIVVAPVPRWSGLPGHGPKSKRFRF